MTQQPAYPSPVDEPRAAFVEDVTFPDGSTVAPNQTLVKTWVMKNVGNDQWPVGTQLVFLGGAVTPTDAKALESISLAQPGEAVQLSVEVRTPARAGHHMGYFRLTTADGRKFGHRIWVDVNVDASAVAPSASVSAEPSSAASADRVLP